MAKTEMMTKGEFDALRNSYSDALEGGDLTVLRQTLDIAKAKMVEVNRLAATATFYKRETYAWQELLKAEAKAVEQTLHLSSIAKSNGDGKTVQ